MWLVEWRSNEPAGIGPAWKAVFAIILAGITWLALLGWMAAESWFLTDDTFISSWLKMAEIELSALTRQCLNRRIPDQGTLRREAAAWPQARN